MRHLAKRAHCGQPAAAQNLAPTIMTRLEGEERLFPAGAIHHLAASSE